jgi:Uma2 family endonuclease
MLRFSAEVPLGWLRPHPSWRHQLIATELHFRLRVFLGSESRGRIAAKAGVRLSSEDVVKPDLAVFLEEHCDRNHEGSAAAGTPDLVVEILSPGTAGRDLRDKRALYERSSIPEYWIVDPVVETIQVLTLARGTYREAALYRRGDALVSPLLPELKFLFAGIP